MSATTRRLFVSIAVASFALQAGVAWADRIDGDWCHRDGRHVAIDGREIVTPAGALLTGVYGRHSFHYVVPKEEPNAWSTVHMFQLSDETMSVRVGPNTAAVAIQEWYRCTRLAV